MKKSLISLGVVIFILVSIVGCSIGRDVTLDPPQPMPPINTEPAVTGTDPIHPNIQTIPDNQTNPNKQTSIPNENQPVWNTVLEKYYNYFSTNSQIVVLMDYPYAKVGFTDDALAAYAILSLEDYSYEKGNTKDQYHAITEKYFGRRIQNFNNSMSQIIPGTDRVRATGWSFNSSVFLILKDLKEQADGSIHAKFYTLNISDSVWSDFDPPKTQEQIKNDLFSGNFSDYGQPFIVQMRFEEKTDENGKMYLKYLEIRKTEERIDQITPYGTVPVVSTQQSNTSDGFAAEAKLPDGVHLTCLEWSTTVVSLTKDGEQLIPGGHSWYFELEKMARGVAGDTEMNLYALDGMYKTFPIVPLRTVPFNNLSTYQTLDGVIDWIAIGGNWQPFPCLVSYQKYTLEDQPRNQEWTDHFAKLLAERTPDTPVIITEAWFFDLDGDGKNEAFVNAGNALRTEKGAKANPPSGKQTGVYSISALFSESLGVVDLDSNIWTVAPDFTGKDISASYTEPVWEKYYENFVTAIKYGENGEYILSPIFNKGEYYPAPWSYPIVCDIDGDGSAELLRFRTQVYGPLNVYSVQGGKLTLRYSIAVSA